MDELDMSTIVHSKPISHGSLLGVTVYPFSARLERSVPQDVLVAVEPGATIPLHSHSVDASMLIVDGEGLVLSSDPALHGQVVRRGDLVYFERNVDHGFKAADVGLTFLSRNGGIVTRDEAGWDISFA
jgi:quercetin dioxygenase-like cupin family protein